MHDVKWTQKEILRRCKCHECKYKIPSNSLISIYISTGSLATPAVNMWSGWPVNSSTGENAPEMLRPHSEEVWDICGHLWSLISVSVNVFIANSHCISRFHTKTMSHLNFKPLWPNSTKKFLHEVNISFFWGHLAVFAAKTAHTALSSPQLHHKAPPPPPPPTPLTADTIHSAY